MNGDILLRGLTPKKFYARTTVSGGYYFTLSSNGFSLTADGGVAGLSPRTILSLTAYNNSAILEENDNLIVTFGEDRLCYEQGSTDLGYGQKCVCDYYLKVVRVEDNGDHTILVDRGVGNTNKIVSSVVVATRTEELNNEYFSCGISLNVGTISGGKQVNMVAGECSIVFDLRLKNMNQKKMILNKIYSKMESKCHFIFIFF